LPVTRFIPAIAWFIASLVLLCLPGSNIPKYPWLAAIHADKLIHITLFFIACYLFAWPLKKSAVKNQARKRWFVVITLSGIGYGIIMEFVQERWIPNRSFEVGDIVADSTGCLLAYLYALKKNLQKGV